MPKRENSRHKINTVWVRNDQTTSDLQTEEVKHPIIENSIEFNSVTHFNIINSFDTDWEVLYYNETNEVLYKEWRISLSKIPKKLVPFIRIGITYKSLETVGSPKTHYLYKLIDTDSRDNMTLEFMVGMLISGQSTPVSVEAKIMIKIFNPEVYY